MTTVLDRLHEALNHALQFDGNVGVAPAALLWPDKDQQWGDAFEALRSMRPMVRLGDYDADEASGPAYWLRCAVAGTLPVPGDGVPIVYMPGVSRDDLRNVTESNHALAPLASLQHRSLWFTHPNGKDWTVRGWFSNADRGLALSVAADDATAAGVVNCLGQLLTHSVAALQGRHIDSNFLNDLLNPDPVHLMLRWLNDPTSVREGLDDARWKAFVQMCRSDFDGFDPEKQSVIDGVGRLGEASGQWEVAWNRFRQGPQEFVSIPERLRDAQPGMLPPHPEAWPGVSEQAEGQLRSELAELGDATASDAREAVLRLERDHGPRRGHVWADLGRTPLVLALEHLAQLAEFTSSPPPNGSVDDLMVWYGSDGWGIDRAVVAALAEVEEAGDTEAVRAVVTAIYRPWLESAATTLQNAIGPEANAGSYLPAAADMPQDGEVTVFVDGLRLDVAHSLEERLQGAGASSVIDVRPAALPTVTQTAKPALVPIDQSLLAAGSGLDARRAPDGPAAGVQVLRPLMEKAGVQTLMGSDTGDPSGRAWTEAGEVDKRGHSDGFRLANRLDEEVQRIARRILDLLHAGWSRVTVVTDHGWLLLPGGLPKNGNLPVAATEVKKGRCARLKDGADVDVPTVPWHWDANVRIALAPGVSCFEANQTYEHGGVSPQECFVPRLTVTLAAGGASTTAEITNLKWQGLVLRVEFAELPDGAKVDLRRHAGDPDSSIAERAQLTGGTGKQLLLVEDDDLEGEVVHLVVVDANDTVLVQRTTVVGQNK